MGSLSHDDCYVMDRKTYQSAYMYTSNATSSFAPFRSTGFSSLGMASRFVNRVRGVDVMSDADNIKKLLRMPYSSGPVSLVVHRVGRTLLVDDFDIHGFLLRTSKEEWAWLRRFFQETVFGPLGPEERHKALVRRRTTADAIRQRNLVSKFLYRSLKKAEEDGKPKEEEEEEEEKGPEQVFSSNASCNPKTLTPLLPPLPEPSDLAPGASTDGSGSQVAQVCAQPSLEL